MRLARAISISALCVSAFAQDSVRTIAGRALENGSQNGAALEARFNDPAALASDPAGAIYIADSRNNCIRRRSPDGAVTTIVTSGSPFDTPSGLAFCPQGLIVSDTGNHVIRRINPDGSTTTIAGAFGQPGAEDGPAAAARFDTPLGLAISTNGVVYIADCGNHVIRAISPGGAVTTIAGAAGVWGATDGSGSNARFNGPLGLALNSTGDLLVSDSNNHTIRKITPAGEVTTWAGAALQSGYLNGDRLSAKFFQPAELAFDLHGALYVADAMNHAIRKISPDGKVSTVAGFTNKPGSTDGENQQAAFYNPYGLTFLPTGELAVADAYNQTIRSAIPPAELQPRLSLNGVLTLHWNAIIGKTYQLQTATATLDAWLNIGNLLTASNQTGSAVIPSQKGDVIFRLQTFP